MHIIHLTVNSRPTMKTMNLKELDNKVPMNGFPIRLNIHIDEEDNPLYTNGKSEILSFRRVINITEILSVHGVTINTNPSRYLIVEKEDTNDSFCIHIAAAYHPFKYILYVFFRLIWFL